MKICKVCGLCKSLDGFHKNGKWYRNTCRKCHNLKYNPPTGKINTGRFQKGNKPINPFKKGQVPPNKGKKTHPDIVAKVSSKLRGRKQSPEEIEKRRKSLLLWWSFRRKNGRSCVYAKEWSYEVKKRDGFKCLLCGSLEKLHAHHIKPWKDYEELRFDITNGITYCNSCHLKKEGFQKGQSYWKGKKMSIEHRKKLSESHKGKIHWNKKLFKSLKE